MKIRILFYILFFAACSQKQKTEEKAQAVPNDLPEMTISLATEGSLELKTVKGKTVLVLFQPDCDHCQHEAKEIEENIAAFRDYTMYFISSAPMPEIKNFANDYKLAGIPNVLFAWTSTNSVINNFGPVQAPSVYIYSGAGKLVKQFNGQVEIGEILKHL